MLRIRQLDLLACLTILISGTVTGCASSAIVDPSLDEDGALASEEKPDADSDAGGDFDDDDADDDADDETPVVPKKDAGTPKADASTTPPKDAGGPDAAKADAGPSSDAGSAPKDAGSDASAPKDAGSDASKPNDAGRDASTEPVGECSQASDCRQICLVTGIFPCCTANHQCGCTYLPGTLCL